MFNKLVLTFLICLMLTVTISANAADTDNIATSYPIYIGILGGYGSTNWKGLVDTQDQDPNVQSFLPQNVQDTGFMYGAFIGYTFTPNFAVEFKYQHFPTTNMTFLNNYTYLINSMNSITNAFSLVGKFIIPIKQSGFSVFAELGPGYTLRSDALAGPQVNGLQTPNVAGTRGSFTAVFGGGITYNFNERVFTTLEGTYATGNGESNALPVNYYIPFLYAGQLELGYRFNI